MDPPDPKERWTEPGAGRAYATARWRRAGHRQRDPLRIGALLARHVEPTANALVLDAPCGNGRLRKLLAPYGHYVGLDVSADMLSATPVGANATWVRGDVEHLPLRDESFSVVVCCRLLHHLEDRGRLERTVAELVRVSSGWVVATFWDSASLPAWKRRILRQRRRDRRVPRHKDVVRAAFRGAGADVVDWRHSLRFLSQQTYVLARRR